MYTFTQTNNHTKTFR